MHEQVIVGLRPEHLVDARGPHRGLERAACPRSEASLLSPVVMVQEVAHDDITAAFLLTQSLRQRQEGWRTQRWGREEDVEEDDGLVEYFSGVACSWRCGVKSGSLRATALPGCCGTPRTWLSSSSGRMSSSSSPTSSSGLVFLVSCFDLVVAGVLGRGQTPSTLVDLPSTATRCFSRRRSWLAGSTMSATG